jgi:hypothetical protein
MKYFRSFTVHIILATIPDPLVDVYFAWDIVIGEDNYLGWM